MKQEFKNLPLHQVVGSRNYREEYDQHDLQELSESIKQQGVIEPIIVREIAPSTYEVVAGGKRHQSSILANMPDIPAMIRELTDDEVLEIQITENLQRTNPHPLFEAKAFQRMLDSKKYTVPEIAVRLAKSDAYVYQRLKLNDLIEYAKETFRRNVLTLSHAVLLARLQPADQEKALAHISDEVDRPKDLPEDHPGIIMEVRDAETLEYWIEANIYLDLIRTKFDKEDPQLFPEAGSCITCPKRTGFNTTLFPDIMKDDSCTDPKCFNTKKNIHIESLITPIIESEGKKPVKISQRYNSGDKGLLPENKYKKVKKNSCSSVETGLILEGEDYGKHILICRNKKCEKHFPQNNNTTSPEQLVKQKQEQEKREDREKVRFLTVTSIAEASNMLFSMLECKEIVTVLWRDKDNDLLTLIARDLQWIKSEEEINYSNCNKVLDKNIDSLSHLKLFQVMKVMLMDDMITSIYHKHDPLPEIAKIYEVDMKAIEKQVAADRKASEEKAEAPVEEVKPTKKKGGKK